MAETKTFRTLEVASTLSGVSLAPEFNITHYCRLVAWMCGYSVWTHEAFDPKVRAHIEEAGYRQFPRMPTEKQATEDFQFAAWLALSAYGDTVSVEQGNHERPLPAPTETLREKMALPLEFKPNG